MESLVTPGNIKSSNKGVTISAFFPFLLLKTKKIFEAPTSITFLSLYNQRICWCFLLLAYLVAPNVGP
jgi:hypothetical protein